MPDRNGESGLAQVLVVQDRCRSRDRLNIELVMAELTKLQECSLLLQGMGASLKRKDVESYQGETVKCEYFEWKNRYIKVSQSILLGIGFEVSEPGAAFEPKKIKWQSIFSLTVPGFNEFDDEQKLQWIISVPGGDDYMRFLKPHIQKLSSVI